MAHDLTQLGAAADLGVPGGARAVACCRCGWHSRSRLTRRLAAEEFAGHVASAGAGTHAR